MNRSWQNNSSPGFMYYQNTPPRPESSDFLAFSPDGSPHNHQQFRPNNCSSPNKSFHRGRGRGGGYHNRGGFNRYSGGSPHWKRDSFNKSEKVDISAYLDLACLEDPWAELEAKHKASLKEDEANKS